jgi:AcrR family transcriptional regulator
MWSNRRGLSVHEGTGTGFRPPRQRRSAETLERIVQAAQELLVERAFDAATVDDIVRRAGSSKGSFYSRFPDKRALLAYLAQRTFAGARDYWAKRLDPERWTGVPLGKVIDRLVDDVVKDYRRAPPPLRALLVYSMTHPEDSEFDQMTAGLNRHVRDLLARLLRERQDELTHPKPAAAARMLLLILDSSVREAIFFDEPRHGPFAVSDAVLRAELRRAALAYLGVTREPT